MKAETKYLWLVLMSIIFSLLFLWVMIFRNLLGDFYQYFPFISANAYDNFYFLAVTYSAVVMFFTSLDVVGNLTLDGREETEEDCNAFEKDYDVGPDDPSGFAKRVKLYLFNIISIFLLSVLLTAIVDLFQWSNIVAAFLIMYFAVEVNNIIRASLDLSSWWGR